LNNYFELKSNRADEYSFVESDLALIAYKLYITNRKGESIPFFERYLIEHPDGQYNELSYECSVSHTNSLGIRTRHLELSPALELNPDNEEAAAKIVELGG